MYHYVRDFCRTQYPRIRGLDIRNFRRQLDYLCENFSIIGYEDIKNHCLTGSLLPSNACWLTFDDGYLDHYQFVFPELVARGLKASFFPPAKVIEERDLLSVNKIHYILASTENVDEIICTLRSTVEENLDNVREGYSFSDYWNEYAKPGRYDREQVIFVKRMLQYALPSEVREKLTNELFLKFVTADLKGFSEDLYMSKMQLREMIDAGMHVGSHGNAHMWLDKATRNEQAMDIDKSLSFLSSIGAWSGDDWVMCYPYGGYNNTTLELLRERGCLLGITTLPGMACLKSDGLLELSRFDTNDMPI